MEHLTAGPTSRVRLYDRRTLEARDYWLRTLGGDFERAPLPPDFRRPPGEAAEPAEAAAEVAGPTREALDALARGSGFLVHAALAAALKVCLYRYAAAEGPLRIAVASPPRLAPGAAEPPVPNVLCALDEIGGAMTFRQVLAAVRQTLLDAFARQDFPFDLAMRTLGVDLPEQRAAFHAVTLATAGVTGELAAAGRDLEIRAEPGGGRLAVRARFDRKRFRPETVERFLGHLGALLDGLLADTGAPVRAVPMMGPAERARVVQEWNRTGAPFPADTVHALFAAQAARSPDAVAVSAPGGALTYAELDARANRLAHHLRRRGVRAEARVGLCLERGADLVVAMLAVLKAGGAYVPLDPGYPAERLAWMVEDSAPAVLVTRGDVAAALPAAGPAVVRLDADRALIGAEPAHAPDSGASPDTLAYVVYTSGSTGTPKGVLVPHRGIVRLVLGADYVRLEPSDRVAHASNPSFDAATFEVWGPLLRGARTTVLSHEEVVEPRVLARRLGEEGVTTLFLTTALFDRVAREAPGGLGTLRHLLFGGEAVDPERVRAALEDGAPRRLLHVYGPTESTTFASWERVRGVPADAATVPIGRGIANTRLYVVDAELEPVPVGVPGELLVAGDGLARGYHGRPELTAAKFVPDPFAAGPGERAYRTGDRARWTPDGSVEFLGRADAQVKIRGFRIEPGEVEAALLRHPAVRDAVATVREDAPGERTLVAYAAGAALPPGAGLRAWLAERLPAYMVPSAVVVLPALPLNANGKTDRSALPAPGAEDDSPAPAAPRTPVEEVLAGIWADVLRLDRAGADSDFFLLGGHSLLATQAATRVRDAFRVRLPLSAIFEAPTPAALAPRVEAALREGAEDGVPPLVPVPRDPARALPLSHAQQRLWLVQQMDPGSAAYNVPFALRLRGELDPGALRRALGGVALRHEVLRTVLREEDGTPAQVVRAPGPVPLPAVDLRALPEDARRRELARIADEEAGRPFDLSRGPLLRCALARLDGADHVLLLTLHHVVCDGWSMDVLARELSALYAGGEAARLPGLPVQYADWAVWQREWLGGGELERQLAWWRERLEGAPPLAELPLDRPRPAVQGAAAGVRAGEIPAEALDALRRLARREGCTLFMTLLAAWQALLDRYCGQGEVVVGTPVAGRTRSEVEGLVGFFVNMLALRTDLSGDPTFAGLLGRVRETALGAYLHQDLPFERLVDELAAGRSPDHAPVFQVSFELVASRGEGPSFGGVRVEPVETTSRAAKFDLDLALSDRGDRLSAELKYREELFDGETAARMLEHFRALVRAVAADPALRLAEVPLLAPAEREQVLTAWNRTAAPYPAASIHEVFAEQAARTPDAAALLAGDDAVTYAELDARANRLANRLRRLGVGPEARVGICLERSAEMIVALLGVLKAGGAYVPLDPVYPADRLAYMAEDAGLAVLLTRERLAGGIRAGGARTLLLDAEADDVARESAADPGVPVPPEGMAYVVYTSGSTGAPKGVAVPHRAVLRLARGGSWVRLGPEETVLHLAPMAFDASTFEVWGALLNGARLAVYPHGTPTPEELGAEVERRGVTTLWLTAGLFHRMVEDRPASFRGVRQLVAGGDVLSPAHVRRLLEEAEGCRLVNGYGPTENTTFSATHSVSHPAEVGGSVPIGRPVENSTAYVLDGAAGPVPVGVRGELYVGGDGVARGYLGRPELTAARFVPDPFAGRPGARMYRTGDAARWRADEVLEFLGRLDGQVKVRGFRVEPGEVEAALREHPDVADAAVLARGGDAGSRRLVAWLVPARDGLLPDEVRAYLRGRLPEYMVPSALFFLDALPLTAHGKTDRRMLREPERTLPEGEHPDPRTPAEELVCGIWAEVLGAARVGIHDDFFAAGGHSLLAMQVVARVRRSFGVEVPLRALFEAPTPAALARRIEVARSRGVPESAPPLAPVPRGEPLPLSFAQQRLWLVHRMDPASPAYNMPYALRLRGPLRPAALGRSLGAAAARHESLRTVFREREGGAVQVVLAPGAAPRLPVVDLRALPEARRGPEALRLAAAEALRPFDLERGPLLRSALLHLAPGDHVLLLDMHHVVSDGWSMEVLVREVSAAYAAFSGGGEPELPPLPVQYGDYAVWQRRALPEAVLAEQAAWWKARLAGAPPLLEVPTDRPRAAGMDARSGVVAFALPAEAAAALRALGRREGATLFMTLLAAWQALLARWSARDDVVVGTPAAGRGRVELEGLIGFFVNLLVLRADLAGDPAFRELLGRVREGTLDAYARQDLPFDRLVDEMGVARSLDHTPLFQAAFALDRAGRTAPALGTVEAEPFGGEEGTAKFDLNLTFGDDGGGLRGAVQYRRALFDAATVERMAGHLRALLCAAAADPSRRLSGLPLLAPADREQVLERWSNAAAPRPRRCIHETFAEQARRAPGAAALTFGGESLTYGELDRRANRLAHHLRRRGVGPDARVAVCLERSPELVVGLLGILKAGGAYAVVDPAYPPERIALMLGETGAPVVLTRDGLLDRLPAGTDTVRLDAGAEALEREPDTDPGVAVTPEHLAYVIYTSGSTGAPKGTEVPHRAIPGFFEGADYARFGPGEVLLQHSSTSWDALTLELWPALLTGGRCVLHPGRSDDLEGLAAAVAAEGVTTLWLSSALFNLVVDTHPGVLAGVRQVMVGGEAVSAAHLGRARERYPELALVNGYGPSECTVFTSCWRLPAGWDGVDLPIGAPVGDRRAYVLDEALGPVPVGVPGELCVGGPAVPRGYLGRPELTAEKLVPDPFGEPGARLYRSGDRVRWRTDGVLEFLGRTDRQAKIRGFRVEPGEVEAALRRHPAVREAAVAVREDVPGEKRLVAYVVAGEPGVPARELREHARALLPEYMVPGAFVALDALPLTPNGKVDVAALPAPAAGGEGEEWAPPGTPTEEALGGIWREVLSWAGDGARDRIGRDDDFFELGGHSLLATQVLARVRQVFGVELEMRAVFEAPTLAAMAARVDAALHQEVEAWELERELEHLEGLSDDDVRALLGEG